MPLVDSFLVRDGHAVAPRGHRDRMRAAAGELWGTEVDPSAIDDAVAALYEQAAHTLGGAPGLFFPKLTLEQRRGELRSEVNARPIAESRLETTAHLIAYPGRDERTRPRLKGPDFAWQERVRAWALERGASDPLLRARSARVSSAGKSDGTSHFLAPQIHYSETAYGSVALWSNGVLVTSSDSDRLPSITESVIVEIARERGHETLAAPLTKQRLLEADAVWLLSSLHGVREATVGLTDLPAPHVADTYAPPRGPFAPAARDFQDALWERAEPIRELSA
ncbi:aminotransferase class IV [Dermabacter hominis]|uniref:aminotransferase class IV n=1 Tax=Dermabacter hominis TaxID=36740 RepID=UPI0021A6B2A4|nr:aminotransferase class IV [Dermabacter hominis]MCT2056306.1 aminotransferase class IV [Dermabacter hominis]MCT2083141.1 aminotransferase class IV [Dermabacter hominis]MCT2091955.1 aminotransferase class IV [Dermabacter hominis]MCT2190158.1 aminotransferase class IV [Dermabacter hominis]MCT2226365.1 aminotransferase class IV [Dermabacter hominis]